MNARFQRSIDSSIYENLIKLNYFKTTSCFYYKLVFLINDKGRYMKQITLGLCLLFISSTAFAHTGMSSSSFNHMALHISASIGITIALIAVGYFFYRRTPKARTQRVRIKK